MTDPKRPGDPNERIDDLDGSTLADPPVRKTRAYGALDVADYPRRSASRPARLRT